MSAFFALPFPSVTVFLPEPPFLGRPLGPPPYSPLEFRPHTFPSDSPDSLLQTYFPGLNSGFLSDICALLFCCSGPLCWTAITFPTWVILSPCFRSPGSFSSVFFLVRLGSFRRFQWEGLDTPRKHLIQLFSLNRDRTS